MNRRILLPFCCCFLFTVIAVVMPVSAVTILEEGPNYSTGLFEQKVSDIEIKVLGGEISFIRRLKEGRWYFAPNWTGVKYKQIANRRINADTNELYIEFTDDMEFISRNGYWYQLDENSNGSVYRYGNDKKIEKSETGLRWSDRSGEWIEYTLDGELTAFGNTSGTTVKFIRNEDGFIDKIQDRNNQTVLTIIFADDKPLSVEDYTGRKVVYLWEDNDLTKVTDTGGKEWSYRYQHFGAMVTSSEYNPMQQPPSGAKITVNGVESDPFIAISEIRDVQNNVYTIHNTFIPGHIEEPCWTDGTPDVELVEVIDPDTGYITIEEVEHNVPGEIYCKKIMVPDQVITGSIKGASLQSKQFSFAYNEDKKTYAITQINEDSIKTQTFYSIDGVVTKQLIAGELVFTQAKVGNIKKIADADGNITTSYYDQYNNITKIVNADSTTSTAVFHPSFDFAVRMVNENGVISEVIYNEQGLALEQVEAKGLAEQLTTTYSYNSDNLLSVARLSGNSATKEAHYEFEYDAYGNLSKEIINNEITWSYQNFTATGQAQTVIDGRGKIWLYEYDNDGNLTKETDPLNHSLQYQYDNAGNLIKYTDANNISFSTTYNSRDQITSSTDAYGKKRYYQHNAAGVRTQYKDERGNIFSLILDRAGRPQSRIDGNQIATTFTTGKDKETGTGGFDDLTRVDYPTYSQLYKYNSRKQVSQLTLLQDSQGTTFNYLYDPVGQLIAETDPNGHRSYYSYDAFGNLTSDDSSGFITQYEYNAFGDLTRFTDRDNYSTEFEYDLHGRLIRKGRAGFGDWIYGYDNNDNLTSIIDPNGQKLLYVYNDANTQIAEYWYADSSDTELAKTISYEYDNNGNMNRWQAGSLSGSSVRDNNGRLTSSTINYGAFSKTYQYSYYDNGTRKTLTMPDGSEYSYQYDANNQLTRFKIPGEGSLTVNQFNWLAPSKETLPGGVTRTTQYTGLLNTKALAVQTPSGLPVLTLSYEYGDAQEIKARNNDGSQIEYLYDDIYRLQQATTTSPTGEVRTETYQLDDNSNRLASIDESNWVYNEAGQLKVRGSVSYDYDANGNQIKVSKTDSQRLFIFDAKDRLVRVEDANQQLIASYLYDPFDRRLAKTVNGNTTYYLYNSEGLIAEYNEQGQELNSYGYRPNSRWGTNPVFIKTGSADNKKVYYYQNDQLGTPYKITDNTGYIVWQTQFDSFGNALLADNNQINNNLRFPGQYFDAETGLHYNWRRYYDPVTGRYITPDPLDLAGGPNLYTYVDGDPINRIDPNGECAILGVLTGVAFEFAYSQITGECFSYTVADAIGDALCGLGKLRKLGKVGKYLKKTCKINSFTPETLVHSEAGLVVIKDIKVGDKVLSYAEWNGEENYQIVTDIITNSKEYNLVLLTLESGEVIESTDLHPFYIVGTGWVEAKDLKLGDPLYRGDKGSISIAKIKREQRTETVYNLSVANSNTYFIGEDKVLVHNAKCVTSRAKDLGYTTRIPPQKVPFDSHGQPAFFNGKQYITPDIDGHNVTDGWKTFSKKKKRTGTWNSTLTKWLKE